MSFNDDDLTNLIELSESSILETLKNRLDRQTVYTYCGTILVALNPYQQLAIYGQEYLKQYSQAKFGELPPHIYAIAQATFHSLKSDGENQSVVISGESGAGKTESTKLILNFLTAVSHSEGGSSDQSWIEQQILEANVILESLGNAKTVRNNNSSRFGKFVQILFDENHGIIGASMVNYLLEKSRITQQAQSERNYHIFYQMTLGCSDAEKAKYKLLPSPEEYKYLNQSGCIDMPDINDRRNFSDLKLALTVLKMTGSELDSLFTILSAVLLLGNINFQYDQQSEKNNIKNPDIVKTLAQMLQVNEASLTQCLTFRQLYVRGESTLVPLKGDQATDNRDSIAKTIYNSLFQFMVELINKNTAPSAQTNRFIGVLDIFGFENFQKNSFEQLCINYTNEKLQQFFNQYIFKLEQEEYAREGIPWSKIDFKDNQAVIDMIESKLGIMSLLDEECRFPKGTDDSFLSKINDSLASVDTYIRPRTAKGVFGIKHYAGDVTYDVKGFLEKNKDNVADEVVELFLASKNQLLQKIFDASNAAGAPGNSSYNSSTAKSSGGTAKGSVNGMTFQKKTTASSNFKGQLSSLVAILSSTKPHYVRCIKPNPLRQPFNVDFDMTIAQLKYSGMLETIRVRKAGYPFRYTFPVFLYKFKCLLGYEVKDAGPFEKIKYICEEACPPELSRYLVVGKSKVFMKQDAFSFLDKAAETRLRKLAIKVQKCLRGFRDRRRYLNIRWAAKHLNRYIKGFAQRVKYQKTKAAILTIQRCTRGFLVRHHNRLEAERMKRKMLEDAESKLKEKGATEAQIKAATQHLIQESEPEELDEMEEELQILTSFTQNQMKKAQEPVASASPEVQKKKPAGEATLDEMFSFLDDFASPSDDKQDGLKSIGNMDAILSSELDNIFGSEMNQFSSAIGEIKSTKKTDNNITTIQAATESLAEEVLNEQKASALATTSLLASVGITKVSNMNIAAAAKKPVEDFRYTDFPLEVYAEKVMLIANGASLEIKKKVQIINEKLSYSKTPITEPLTKISDSMVPQAIENFKNILKIGEIPKKAIDDIIIHLGKVLSVGISNPELRDEIYFQLMKQCSSPLSEVLAKNFTDSILQTWFIMVCCCACFPPSKQLYRYLLAFIIKKGAEANQNAVGNEINDQSLKAEGLLRLIYTNGSRKLPLSMQEIKSLHNKKNVKVKFYFLDGQMKPLEIAPTMQIIEVLKELTKQIGLKESSGWGLYEQNGNDASKERYLKLSDYIADVVAVWESSVGNGGVNKDSAKKGTEGSLFSLEDPKKKLVVKKRVIKNQNDSATDPIEYNLLYAQAAISVLRNDYGVSEKIALQLAGLRAQINWNDADPNQKSRFKNLADYIPEHLISNQSQDAWVNGIIESQTKLKGKTALQCKVLYLETCKQFKLYGTTLFEVTYEGFWSFSDKVHLGISCSNLYVIHLKTKNILASYKAEQVANWLLEDNNHIIIELRKNANPPIKGQQEDVLDYNFICERNEEMAGLMVEYYSQFKSSQAIKRKEVQSIGAVEKDEDKARDDLLLSRALRFPGPDILNKQADMNKKVINITFSKTSSTVKNIVRAAEIVRQTNNLDLNMLRESYTKADWSFSKARLNASILHAEDDEIEFNNQAMSACVVLQIYAGLADPKIHPLGAESKTHPFSNTAPMTQLIQTVIFNMISNPRYGNEVFLQLIRQTTNPLEPDSKIVINYWNFIMLAVAVTYPTIPSVLTYLKAHLKAVSIGTAKMEARIASQCLKLLAKNLIQPLKRQYPPSIEEIKAILQMRDCVTRFYSADGQSRALPFDSSTSVGNVYEMLSERLNLRNKDEFALYELFDGKETRLENNMLMADVIFKWEKFCLKSVHSLPANLPSKDKIQAINELQEKLTSLKFLIRKRLSLNPLASSESEIEEALVLFQAIDDVMGERHPVTVEEAISLGAIRIQVDMGDQNFRKLPSYDGVVEKYIPKHIVQKENRKTLTQMLENTHGALKGTVTAECNKKYLEIIRHWQYHGSSHFQVQQNYTNDMPKDLIISINCVGVHVFEKLKRDPIVSFPFRKIVGFSPSENYLLIIVDDGQGKGAKSLFLTDQALSIAHLIKDYIDVLSKYQQTLTSK